MQLLKRRSGAIYLTEMGAFIARRINIALLTNCATRLRIKVHEPEKVAETQYFQEHGAVNMVRNGDSFQIIVGLTVPQVREEMTQLIRA
ncbi:PTS transporter subunit EIIB [Citrobacter freundii]